MRGKYHKINIVLTIVFVVLLMGNIPSAIAAGFAYGEEKEWDQEYERKYELVGDMSLELIGDEYEEEKQKGYLYYRLVLPVLNTGRHNMTADDLYIQVEGEDYSDVYEYYAPYDENESDLIRYDEGVIPSMQQGAAEKVFKIRKGVEQVCVTFYENSEDYYEESNGKMVTVFLGE